VKETSELALPAHELQAVEITLKSVNNEVHFTLEDENFKSVSPSQCGEVTEICHTALPAHALRAVKVRLKSVSNEGHFTLEAETIFRSYLPSHCSGVTEI
jgi:hypothetical protein